ncbi:MAG: tetratricopeptide repeat protein, partial [Chloroflexi bacterium]|nr:tetratricopeptide repeat protein [Chloroflexota bacterium]
REDIGRFIEVSSGIAPPAGLVSAVHTQTEGNPLFVTEVVRLLVQEGELTHEKASGRDSWSVRIPEGVREVIGRRLNRLSQRCNETLTIASVIGREFELRQLNKLIDDATEDMILDVLEEALSARVIEELPSAMGRYQFTHALMQETLVEELSLTRRARLHARIAEVLEELYGAEAEAHAAELAHHFAQAEAILGTEMLLRYSIIAGERALATNAYEEALVHFERAMAAKEGHTPSTGSGQAMDAEMATILAGLGRARINHATELRQRQEAFDNLSRALDYYAEARDIPKAMAIATPGIMMLGIRGITQFIIRAMELVPPESLDAGRLQSRLGLALFYEKGDDHGAQEAFNKALVIAQREEDRALESWTSTRASSVDFHNLRYDQSLKKSLRAIELANLVGEPYAEQHARTFAAGLLLIMGDPQGARQHAEALLLVSERLRLRLYIGSALSFHAEVARLEGNWHEARDFSDRALAVRPTLGIGSQVLLEYETGEFSQGEAYLERLLETRHLVPLGASGDSQWLLSATVIPMVARITDVPDRFEVAEETAKTVLSSPHVQPMHFITARVGLALMSVLRGDAKTAEEQYAATEFQKGTMLAFLTLEAMCSMVSADRLLGLLAQTMGNLDDAQAHFEDALAFCRKAGYRPELAWTCCDYADALLQRSASGDGDKAHSFLEESLSISTELGMRPLMERVTERLERLQSQPDAAPAYPDGLTEREVEVLRLIAGGKTNLEIAEELVIAEGTARRHVANIYEKIGAANRVEAASYAAREGLVPVDGQNSTA